MTEQAERERAEPLLPTVEPVMEGKELFTCQMAADDFRKILGIMGGPLEKERGEKLLSTLTIVPDDPSPRAAALKESASIKTRAKVIFGTADSLKVIQCVFGRWLIDARAHTNMVTCTHTDTHQLIHANKKKHTHTHTHTHTNAHTNERSSALSWTEKAVGTREEKKQVKRYAYYFYFVPDGYVK